MRAKSLSEVQQLLFISDLPAGDPLLFLTSAQSCPLICIFSASLSFKVENDSAETEKVGRTFTAAARRLFAGLHHGEALLWHGACVCLRSRAGRQTRGSNSQVRRLRQARRCTSPCPDTVNELSSRPRFLGQEWILPGKGAGASWTGCVPVMTPEKSWWHKEPSEEGEGFSPVLQFLSNLLDSSALGTPTLSRGLPSDSLTYLFSWHLTSVFVLGESYLFSC